MATRDHRIRFRARLGWNLVERCYGPKILTHLPEPLAEWISGPVSRAPLVVQNGGSLPTISSEYVT